MSEFIIHNGELYHHGVKGMKWGVRRFRKKDGSLTPAGKKRYGSDDQYEALQKEAPNVRTRRQLRKYEKQYKRYDKSADKDIRKAIKDGDNDTATRISAGRTYAKAQIDPRFLNRIVTDASIQANSKIGKDFTYKILRNDKIGGVDVTIDGRTSSYVYDPSNNLVKQR